MLFVYMFQNHMVDLRDKTEVFGFENFVDGFVNEIRHHLMNDN